MENNYIIDVDTGIDDALALILASKIISNQVLGITTCGGNVKLEDATNNTLKILDMIKWSVPVYSGSAKSIEGNEFVYAYDYHGTNGIGDVELISDRLPEKTNAVDFIIETANNSDSLDIICLATPTNLAKAILQDPTIGEKINSIYIMGGAVNVPGNQTEYAEYNFFQDPTAVEIVLKNIKNIYLVPLDITNQCLISSDEASAIKPITVNSTFVKELVINWYRFFGYPKKRQFELYDPIALSAAANKDFLEFTDSSIGIKTNGLRKGEIFVGGPYQIKFAQSVKAREFVKFFMEILDK